jgi:glycosyltransferase involved in cell wall biosynthesis
MIMGKQKPTGLQAFSDILKREEPDIIHFHEISPGRGINIFHVEQANLLKIPIVLTFHLSGYSCIKGSLIYKDERKCDGLINTERCTSCVYHSKNISGIKEKFLSKLSHALFKRGIDLTNLNSTIGTALGFPFVIDKIKNDLLKLAFLAENIVVLTKWYKDILLKNGVPSDKLIFIKQGVTNEQKPQLIHANCELPLQVVFIGRISPLKGLHLLITAICDIPADKISLFIYGQETEDGYLLDCKQLSKGKNNIHWMGVIPSTDVIKTLSKYHMLCLPSTFSEMSPLVIQEAFAAGLPVLASDVYGNAEQIKVGINGWLFRFNDSNDLADKLKYLIDDLKLIETAKDGIPNTNSFSNVSKMYLDLYLEILSIKK